MYDTLEQKLPYTISSYTVLYKKIKLYTDFLKLNTVKVALTITNTKIQLIATVNLAVIKYT
jgi:hypothetical protein